MNLLKSIKEALENYVNPQVAVPDVEIGKNIHDEGKYARVRGVLIDVKNVENSTCSCGCQKYVAKYQAFIPKEFGNINNIEKRFKRFKNFIDHHQVDIYNNLIDVIKSDKRITLDSVREVERLIYYKLYSSHILVNGGYRIEFSIIRNHSSEVQDVQNICFTWSE